MKGFVSSYLEHVSSAVFDDYHDQITEMVGKHHGVYALYKRNRLYYVGLAKDLRGRVKYHLKDKHADKWDTFSLYLIRDVEHLKELEALVLHIAEPKGNVQTGKFISSRNLLSELEDLMELGDKEKRESILRRTKRSNPPKADKRSTKKRTTSPKPRTPALAGFFPPNTELRARYKKVEYSARVDEQGRIILNGQVFGSPSSAGSHVRNGKATDGWVFWKYQDEMKEWKLIDTLRKKQTG